ncbi:MAG: FAD-binding protein [Planctomycetaceae bacterium]|jgi:flavin-dependent dehydrogenase|nr:FAD-binding protein [Planctomycetaceae bacterium]
MYDVAIVGAGPAGATLARLLSRRCRVLLLHRQRKKCCGGILSPESQKMLAKFDLALPREVLVNPQPFAVAVWDLQSQLVRHYARQYVNIDREIFDHWLVSLIPSDVDVRMGTVYRYSQYSDKNSLEIFFTENNEIRSEQVRFLVGADGSFSTVRREFFANRPNPKRYTALQEWFELQTVLPENSTQTGIDFQNDYVGIFDSEITDFYAWMIPKNEQIILGGTIPFGNKTREIFERFKAKLRNAGLRFDFPVHREAGFLFRPLNPFSVCLGSDRVFLIGEAAGLISPSSAEGISSALTSAYHLAQTFDSQKFNLAAYRKNLRLLRWQLLLKMVKIPVMFYPWFRKQIMLSGLTALDHSL